MMSRPFYDPLSERWIKPRLPAEEAMPTWLEVTSAKARAAVDAASAQAQRADADRIWAITRQVAEGCNISTRESGETACQD